MRIAYQKTPNAAYRPIRGISSGRKRSLRIAPADPQKGRFCQKPRRHGAEEKLGVKHSLNGGDAPAVPPQPACPLNQGNDLPNTSARGAEAYHTYTA